MKKEKLKTNYNRKISELYCPKCGSALILEYKFFQFNSSNGKKIFHLIGVCPKIKKGIIGKIRNFLLSFPLHTNNTYLDTREEDELDQTIMYIS